MADTQLTAADRNLIAETMVRLWMDEKIKTSQHLRIQAAIADMPVTERRAALPTGGAEP